MIKQLPLLSSIPTFLLSSTKFQRLTETLEIPMTKLNAKCDLATFLSWWARTIKYLQGVQEDATTPAFAYELMRISMEADCFKHLNTECKGKPELDLVIKNWFQELLPYVNTTHQPIHSDISLIKTENANRENCAEDDVPQRLSHRAKRSLWSEMEDNRLFDAIVLFADAKMIDVKTEVGRILDNLGNLKIEKGLVSCIRGYIPKRTKNSLHNRIKYLVRKDFHSFRLKVLNRLAARQSACTPLESLNLQFFEEARKGRIAASIRPLEPLRKKTLECMIRHGAPVIVDKFSSETLTSKGTVDNETNAFIRDQLNRLDVEDLMNNNLIIFHQLFTSMGTTEIKLVTEWADVDIVTKDSFVLDIILSDSVVYTLLNQNGRFDKEPFSNE